MTRSGRIGIAVVAWGLAFVFAAQARAQGPFVNFESPQSPHALAVAGDRLFVVNTPDNRLSVFDLTVSPPSLLMEIPVGLDPIAVAPRPGHPNEVWVANHVSDDVTIVDLALGVPVASIAVPDEPADILFTKDGARAYVSASQANKVVSIDASTRQIASVFAIPMEEPRALALSRNGRFLVVTTFESGNHTTVLPADAAPPTNPQVGLIISDTDPRSTISLPDKDLFIIKVQQDVLLQKTVKGIGTINFAAGVHPGNNRVYVANTEALNLVQFEPNLRGHIIDSRVTIVSKSGTTISVNPVDLNPTVDYGVLPNPDARAIALSQPAAVEFDPTSGNVFVAAFGSGRVAVLDANGAVLARIGVGAGPRALAFDAVRRDLFVLNRIDNTVSVIDADAQAVTSTRTIGQNGFDPTPAVIRDGRPFLYDANLSGNGTAACASCHVDATTDHVAWDLGNPDLPPDPQFAALKGPMFTQSLRDLGTTEPYHWRGDRPTFLDFAPAFDSLMGAGATLPVADMQKFQDFIFTAKYPPNPNLPKNRSFTTAAQRGLVKFVDPAVFGGALSCSTCHAFPMGEIPFVVPGPILNESQGFNPGLLPGSFEKTGFFSTGYGFLHDGTESTVQTFLSNVPPFPPMTPLMKNDFAELVMQWDTGIAPSVGRRVTLNAATADDPGVVAMLTEMQAEVPRTHVDLVAHGTVLGQPKGTWYDPRVDRFVGSSAGDPQATLAQLRDAARDGNAVLTFTAVPVGSGPRIGVDRDFDDLRDEDEVPAGADPLDADTDDDSFLDGIEVAAGSNPNDGGSVPATISTPVITSAGGAIAPPWPSFQRLAIQGTGIALGAVVAATDTVGTTTEHLLFPTGAGTWAVYEPADQSFGSTFSGLSLVVRNRDGGVSVPFVVP